MATSATASVATAAAIPRGRPGEFILVVEDDAQMRSMSIDSLKELGYAADGNQALEQLQAEPNLRLLLFTDIIMPGMTGRQLADIAVQQRPDLKVLFTTGYTRNAVVHNGVLDHGVMLLAKPFTLEQLAHKLREVLGTQRG